MDEPHADVGEVGPVGRPGCPGVLPERHRLPVGGQPFRRAARQRHPPHVGHVAVEQEQHLGAVGGDHRVAGPGRRRHRLQAPVRRRLQVLAGLGGDPVMRLRPDPRSPAPGASLIRCPPRPRTRPASPPPGPRSWPGRTHPPAPGPPAARWTRACGRPPAYPLVVTSSGLSGSPAAASTPSETTNASAPQPVASSTSDSTAANQGPVSRAGCQRQVAIGVFAVALAALVGESDPVRKPAVPGVDVDRAVEHVRVAVEDLLGAVAVMGVDVDHGDLPVPGPEGGDGDGGVVEVTRPAEEAPAGMVARWPADGVGGGVAGDDQPGGGGGDAVAARMASALPGPISVIVSKAKVPARADIAFGMRPVDTPGMGKA